MRTAFAALFLLCLATPGLATTPAPRSGVFSREAQALWDPAPFEPPNGAKIANIPSPDRRSNLEVRFVEDKRHGERLRLTTRGAIGRHSFFIVNGPNPEASWSPDSKAVFVTENDGGALGGFELFVVGRFNGKVGHRDLTPLITRRFGHPVRCFSPETPNVAGVGWLGNSHRLLAAAEIVPHSNCDSMGNFVLYEADPYRLTVVQAWTQRQAKRRFGSLLGPELTNAYDCATPKDCHIPQLHPEDAPRR